jgi:alpha-amylase/alpha-mannosidase (GH57 family)
MNCKEIIKKHAEVTKDVENSEIELNDTEKEIEDNKNCFSEEVYEEYKKRLNLVRIKITSQKEQLKDIEKSFKFQICKLLED